MLLEISTGLFSIKRNFAGSAGYFGRDLQIPQKLVVAAFQGVEEWDNILKFYQRFFFCIHNHPGKMFVASKPSEYVLKFIDGFFNQTLFI